MKNKVVVITGASAGIGAVLAELVAEQGGVPVLTARRDAELRAVAKRCGQGALAIPADMTRRDEVQRVLDAALARHGRIDVWVNNVGRGITRLPTELTDDDLDEMMRVNVKSALYGMQAVLPHFKSRNEGHLVNVSSVLGRIPLALVRSAYSASKHFLSALTANFRMELRATHPGIQVSLVSPGAVATDFGLNALHGGADSRSLPFSQSAREVAQIIASVIEKPRADVYSRPDSQQQIIAYYSAEDLGAAEQQPPFVRT
ncbi:MAG: SDR family NAD(P)-dependent oxidoreductase [Myxococcaceae bacterium]